MQLLLNALLQTEKTKHFNSKLYTPWRYIAIQTEMLCTGFDLECIEDVACQSVNSESVMLIH